MSCSDTSTGRDDDGSGIGDSISCESASDIDSVTGSDSNGEIVSGSRSS